MVNEHSFIRAVHRHLSSDVFHWKIHDKYAGGVPDAMYVGPAGVLFVEYKYLKSLPKRPTTPVKINISPLQIAWLERINQQKFTNICCVIVIGYANNAFMMSVEDSCKPITSQQACNISMSFAEVAHYIQDICCHGQTPSKGIKPSQAGG